MKLRRSANSIGLRFLLKGMGCMIIKELDESVQKELAEVRGEIVVSRGHVHRLDRLPGYIALVNGLIAGLITYHIQDDECEIVSLDSKLENRGIGSALIKKVLEVAKSLQCKRVWLITSNDNIRAIRFYQKRGFDLAGIHLNAITEARKIKPSIPVIGYDDIPVKHEIEFEMGL